MHRDHDAVREVFRGLREDALAWARTDPELARLLHQDGGDPEVLRLLAGVAYLTASLERR